MSDRFPSLRGCCGTSRPHLHTAWPVLRHGGLLGLLAATGLLISTLAKADACVVPRQPSVLRPAGPDHHSGPISLSAERLSSQLDAETSAQGDVELRRGGLVLTADSLRYLESSDYVEVKGHVRITRGGDQFKGREAGMQLDTEQGFVLGSEYQFARTGAGGRADRMDFNGTHRLSAQKADYTSCARDNGSEPDWALSMNKLDLNFDTNEGWAEGAVLRFLGVPILALPVMSFPATEAPKSGWLPPVLDFDSVAGTIVSMSYYWRLAPNRDLTLTPVVATQRGTGLIGEYRYLTAEDSGSLGLHSLPQDNIAQRERHSFQLDHDGRLGGDRSAEGGSDGLKYHATWQQASDDNYWKDFSRQLPSLTPRLLPQDLQLGQLWGQRRDEQFEWYARAQGWQTLQSTADPITVPYARLPQLGLRWRTEAGWGLRYELETEGNRFSLRDYLASTETRIKDGSRLHLVQALSRPVDAGWAWFTPKLSLNAAHYQTAESMSSSRALTSAGRVIPSFSIDSGMRLERDIGLGGRNLLQTLEPRLHYVNTPRRDQSVLPTFDTAASDFNELSIYADNAFTGVDRVSDANQLTFGATTRFLDQQSGEEHLSLGVAQRLLFRSQLLTADGTPNTRQFSDVLLFGSGSLARQWRLDTTVQYNPDIQRSVRSIIAARYQPGPFMTLAGTYRYARDLSEQFDLGWQWPVYRGRRGNGSPGSCEGTLYSVGRVNYSMVDSRITESLIGFEYDAGCWIARAVVERKSTAQSEARSHLMIQLELVGLSRLGSNPLQVLKDNIPGYRLLRDDAATPSSSANP